MRRKGRACGRLKFSRISGRRPDWQELIFLHKRKRLFPKNAGLTYTPSVLIDMMALYLMLFTKNLMQYVLHQVFLRVYVLPP